MIRPLLLFPILAALALSAVPAVAQRDTVPDAPRSRGGMGMIGGVRVGWPQKVSAYVGIGIAEKRFESGYTGWSITVEPGIGGGLVGIGRTTTGVFGLTARTQAAVLRTWGDPWMVGPHQTYVGAEVQAHVVYVGLALGAYARVPHAETGSGALLTVGFVFGN